MLAPTRTPALLITSEDSRVLNEIQSRYRRAEVLGRETKMQICMHIGTVEPRLYQLIAADTIEVDLDYSNFFIFSHTSRIDIIEVRVFDIDTIMALLYIHYMCMYTTLIYVP